MPQMTKYEAIIFLPTALFIIFWGLMQYQGYLYLVMMFIITSLLYLYCIRIPAEPKQFQIIFLLTDVNLTAQADTHI
jgi:hypothetical protein